MRESTDWPAAASALWGRLSDHLFVYPAGGLDLSRRRVRERFADPGRRRHVDLHRQWVLPRPRLPGRRGFAGVGLILGALAAGTATALPLDPVEPDGGSFLAAFVALALAALMLSSWLRSRLRDTGPGRADALDYYQLAYLAAGSARAVDTGVTDLLQQGFVWLEKRPSRVHLTGAVADLPAPLRVLGAAIVEDAAPAAILRNATTWLQAIEVDLVSRGLALSAAQARRVRRFGALPLLAVAAFGLVGVLFGLRGPAVDFLFILMLALAAFGQVRLARAPLCTRAGERVLDDFRARNARRIGAQGRNGRLLRAPAGDELLLAVALGGTVALLGSAYAAYRGVMPATDDGGGGGLWGDGGADCGGGDCGGGDGGGGG